MTANPIRRDPDDGRIYVAAPEEVPSFGTDEEERAFWRTHTFSPESWEGGAPSAPRSALRARVVQDRQHPNGARPRRRYGFWPLLGAGIALVAAVLAKSRGRHARR